MIQFSEHHLTELMQWLSQLFWPFLRVSGFMMVAPVLGDNRVSNRVKIGLCAAITLVIAPGIDGIPVVESLTAQWLLLIINQLLIGLAIGFILQLAFHAVVVAGESISMTMGLGYALMNDPSNGIQVPIISQFYTFFVTLLFLAFNGHHELISLIRGSFDLLPVGVTITDNMLWLIVEWSVVLFVGALHVAIPALAALLTVNLIMGIITRSAPQLNLFSVGFPVTMMLGFLIILLTIPSVAAIFEMLVLRAFETIQEFLEIR